MLRSRIRRSVYRRAEAFLGAIRLVEARPLPVSNRTSVREAPPPKPAPAVAASAPAGEGPTVEAVQVLLDDLVRPALQMDGGDITLIKVEEGDVYVELVGACSSCPSSVMTMKLGVERLLEDELPGFRSLIDITSAAPTPSV